MRGVSRAGLVACLAVLLMASATDAGSLYPIGSFPTSPVITPCSVVAADVDGDTVPDLVVVSADNGTGSVLLGNGDGTFQAAVSYAAGFVPASIAAADLDGDAFLDLVAGTQGFSVSVLFNLSEDSDGDGVGDATDNCVNTANPGQEASTQDGLVGLGCACLCGDVNDSCTVSGADAQDIQLQILPNLGTQDDCYDIGDPPFDEQGLCGTPQTTEPRGCDVNASGSVLGRRRAGAPELPCGTRRYTLFPTAVGLRPDALRASFAGSESVYLADAVDQGLGPTAVRSGCE